MSFHIVYDVGGAPRNIARCDFTSSTTSCWHRTTWLTMSGGAKWHRTISCRHRLKSMSMFGRPKWHRMIIDQHRNHVVTFHFSIDFHGSGRLRAHYGSRWRIKMAPEIGQRRNMRTGHRRGLRCMQEKNYQKSCHRRSEKTSRKGYQDVVYN